MVSEPTLTHLNLFHEYMSPPTSNKYQVTPSTKVKADGTKRSHRVFFCAGIEPENSWCSTHVLNIFI